MAPPRTKSNHDAGRRKVYAELQENRGEDDVEGYGHAKADWQTVAKIWCEVLPLSGRELIQARGVQSDTTHRIEWGYDPAYTPRSDWRLKVGERIFRFIEPPRDAGDRHEVYEAQARELEPRKPKE